MEESPDCTSSTVTEGANLRLIFPLAACIVLKVKVRTLSSDHGATALHPRPLVLLRLPPCRGQARLGQCSPHWPLLGQMLSMQLAAADAEAMGVELPEGI